MKDQIVRIKLFTPVDFLEEEKYLEEMHKKGYKLVQIFGRCYYVFQKCEPEDVIYRLDFQNDKETDEYLKMAEDYNWEYVAKDWGFVYFRKKVSESSSESDLEFFTDNASRLEMVKHLVRKRLIPIGIVLLLTFIPIIYEIGSFGYLKYVSVLDNIVVVLIYLSVLIHSIRKIRKMKGGVFDVEKNSNRYVKIMAVLSIIYFLVPGYFPTKEIGKSIKKIDADDFSEAYIIDMENKDRYEILDKDNIERLVNLVFSEDLKKDGRFRAKDTIDNKELYAIYLWNDDEKTGEEAGIYSKDIIVYNMDKYVLKDNGKLNLEELNNIAESGKLQIKCIKYNGNIYCKTDKVSKGPIENLEMHLIETFVDFGKDVINNGEANFLGDRYQVVDENTLNVAVEDKWYIFEKQE